MSAPQFPPFGACDSHVHVVGPKAIFPLAARRSYTPMDAPVGALRAMLKRLGLDRAVLVQPSFYGTDNACLLAALAELGEAARGVAVVAPDITAAELDTLHRAGVRGIRVNVVSLGGLSTAEIAARLHDTAKLCLRNGWHIQAFMPSEAIVALAATLRALAVPVVIDHFGLVNPADLDGAPARQLIELLATGRVWVKLSAPYRITEDIADPRVGQLARRLADANPEQVVWASDWPHTPVHHGTPVDDDRETPYRDIDTARLLAQVAEWFPEPRRQQSILVDNPARLYGFTAPAA
ncbi:MAG: amidohydrolase family protein [Variibacter sp.]|nr:amidohydrolase family protein [Variibacter sp.]